MMELQSHSGERNHAPHGSWALLLTVIAMLGIGVSAAGASEMHPSAFHPPDYAPVGWAKVQPLSHLATEAQLVQWKTRSIAVFELVRGESGQRAARVVYPSYEQSGDRWSTLRLDDEEMPTADWSAYRYLRISYASPRRHLPITIALEARGYRGFTWRGAWGRGNVAQIDLRSMPRHTYENIRCLKIYVGRPHMPVKVWLWDVRLATKDLGVLAGKIDAKLARYLKLLEARSSATTDLQKQCASIRRRIAARYRALAANPNDTTGNAAFEAIQRARRWLGNAKVRQAVELGQYAEAASRAPEDASFYYGVAPSTTKVMWKDHLFPGELGGTAELSVAGNAAASIQIAALTFEDVEGLTAEVVWENAPCPLIVRKGWVGHVKTEKPQYPVTYVGWWPDPILTFLESVDVPAHRTEALWLTVRAPSDAPAGSYRGHVRLSDGNGTTYRVPLRVHVYPFDLPEQGHLPLAMTWFNRIPQIYCDNPKVRRRYRRAIHAGKTKPSEVDDPKVARLLRLRKKTFRFLLRKRVGPDNIYRRNPPNLDEVERWISRGMTRFNVRQATYGGKSERSFERGDPFPKKARKKILAELERVMPKIERRGLLKYAYFYGFDEIGPDVYSAMRDLFSRINERWPRLDTMTTARDETYGLATGLADAVDIWVPTTARYHGSQWWVRTARRRGEKIWWYVCIGPPHPYANFFIEYRALEPRLLMGTMAFGHDIGGFLYYSMNRWFHGTPDDRITSPLTTGPLTEWDPTSWQKPSDPSRVANGDGSLFYPGPHGPLSSIRLENIRDGLEDYEYLWMLQQAVRQVESGQRSEPASGWLERARDALSVPHPLKSLTNFTHDPSDLAAYIDRIGRLLAVWAREYGSNSFATGTPAHA